MSATDTNPASQEVLSVETLALVADMTAELGTSETISSASVTLTQLDTGLSYPAGLSGTPTITGAGKLITQVVTNLLPGKSYRLMWIATVATNKIVAAKTLLTCPF